MNIKPELLKKECFGLGHYPCNYSLSSDGRIIIPVSHAEGQYALYSDDNGKSFVKRELPKNMKDVGFRQLSDGTFMAFGSSNALFRALYDKDTKEDICFCMPVYRADSMDDILEGRVSTSFAYLDIPGLTAGYGDSGNRHSGCVVGWRELSNGDIYLTMYGQFRDDTTLCPYFEQYGEYKFYLYRTWAMVSHDKGKTFEFVCTVADCQTYPIKDINAEGYCESDIEEIEEGHLVCILRTGGHEVYSPLYCAHSYDYGKTWEAPYEICDWGVLPRLMKMKDGTLVIASGHIHTMFLFSEDDGKTWSEPFIVEFCDGKWGDSPSGYTSLFETEPGVLTIVFDDPKEGKAEGGEYGKIRKVYSAMYRIR